MPEYFINGATGNDANSGASETQAWKTLDLASPRLRPGDILTALPGTLRGTFSPSSGTAAAPIRFRAKEAGAVTVDGSERVDGLPWARVTNGWQALCGALVFNVFQRTFETDGKLANFNNRDFNQYNSNPQLDLHGTPAEFKWQNGTLRLNAIPSTPSAEPLYAATREVAINLNGKSHVVVEGIVTRGHKHAVATNGGTGIHLSGCRFTFCGSTAVWLVGLADASMVNCVVQGAGSWGGHYEDCVHTERVGNLRLDGLDLSYGGHSGLIMLDGVPGKITLKSCYFHAMGGSLLTLKRGVDGLLVEDCWLAEAAKSTAVDAHKVPHAGIQLSGRGHVFRNCVFRDNGKDILASSDGNADSNPVCSDNLFDRCTLTGCEAGAVEGQEYAPAGRLERNTWKDCIIKGDVALFYAGQGSRGNALVHCQVVGSTNRGVIATDCSSGPLPNTGSTLTAPPTAGGGGGNGGTVPTKPVLTALTPANGLPGAVVRATGTGFGSNPAVVVSVTVKDETPSGKRRLENLGGSDTGVVYRVPADAVDGPVFVRNMGTQLSSNELPFDVTGDTPPPLNRPPVANAGGPYTGVVGQAVRMDGGASSDPDGTIVSYRWEFGDGQGFTSVIPAVGKLYAKPGIYTVTLTVTDNQGATGTVTTTATITAAPPSGDLAVYMSADQSLNGAVFHGTVEAGAPLPAGSTITVTARTPDGRTGTTTVPVPGTPPTPATLHLDSLTPRDCHVGDMITAAGSGFVVGMFANLQTTSGSRLRVPMITSLADANHATFIVPVGAGPSNVMLEDPATTPPRFSNTAALNVQPVPPPTDGSLDDVFQFNGSASDVAALRGSLTRIFFPWPTMLTEMQRRNIQRIVVEFADLSQYGALLTVDHDPTGEIPSGTRLQMVAFEDNDGDHDHDDDHTHILWSDQLAGNPDEPLHYVAGLAWSSGKLQVEQSLKSNAALVDLIVSAEVGHMADFFWLSAAANGDPNGPQGMHTQLLALTGETNPWWWGSYSDLYFQQPGENWMAGFGLSYSDFVQMDTRFAHPYTKAQAPEVRRIVKLPRTDGKG